MAIGKVKIIGGVTGILGGDLQITTPEISTTAPIGQRDLVDLASGNNTITIPSGTKALIFVPPSTNTQTLTLKGVGGDTGIALHKTAPFCIAFDTAPASIVVNAGGTVNDCAVIFV